jgi:hypothetical protein
MLPMSAFAGSQVSGATITNLQISKSYGNFVFIQVSSTPTGAPACANSSWHYTLSFGNPSDNQLYAMLLTAYSSGALVNIAGTGNCNDVGFTESLQALQLTH